MNCPFLASQKNASHVLKNYDSEYPCLASRDHDGDHVVEVESGKTLAIPKLPRGRPSSVDPLSERVMIRFGSEDVARIDRLRGERSRSSIIREWVREAMKDA